jgi:hypothetical protein
MALHPLSASLRLTILAFLTSYWTMSICLVDLLKNGPRLSLHRSCLDESMTKANNSADA